MYRAIVSLCITAVLAGLGGCAGKPDVVYEPPVEMGDLAPGLTTPAESYALLTDAGTEGRFACALAIAKLVPHEGDNGLDLVLEATRPTEQAYWTEQMRGVRDLREIMFLSPLSVRPEPQTTPNLGAAAARLGASLLLVYAPNGLGPNSAQVLGVLYELPGCRPLATLHASSRIMNTHGQEVSPDSERGDHRDEDARYQAQRAFEGHTLACLRDLMHLDVTPPTTQPHKWHQPLIERWWVPGRR